MRERPLLQVIFSWEQLIVMLFGIFSRCDSMGEVCDGMRALAGKLNYPGMESSPHCSLWVTWNRIFPVKRFLFSVNESTRFTTREKHLSFPRCSMTGVDPSAITKDKLYQMAHRLYDEKDGLERHFSNRTNDLFSLDDKIIIYDLKNTFFEGRMQENTVSAVLTVTILSCR